MKKLISSLLLSVVLSGCGFEGDRGLTGPQGASGTPGQSAQTPIFKFIRFSSDTAVCPSGSGVIIQVLRPPTLFGGTTVEAQSVICDGLNGVDGPIGPEGPQGDPGADGEDGATPAASPYEVTQVIDPCGDASGIYDEVILKMANGTLIGSFSDNSEGRNTRLSLLTPGSYVTTDGSNCHFSVSVNGSITW